MGTGGDVGAGGSAGGTTGLAGMMGTAGTTGAGGAGGMLSASDQNKALINAPAATGVTALDPSIAGTPKTYMTGGVCQ